MSRAFTGAVFVKIVGVCAVLGLLAPAAWAQSNACVYNQPGGGYVAKMRIVSGAFKTDWSSGFPIGKSACQSLEQIPNGQAYKVEVHAVAGKTVTCEPTQTRSTSFTGNIVYHCGGTTFIHTWCQQPGAEKPDPGAEKEAMEETE